MRIVQAAHHETSEVEKKMMFYKSTVELVNEKFGGIEAIEEQIKIAKLKEQSVGNLMNKLDTCIVSLFLYQLSQKFLTILILFL